MSAAADKVDRAAHMTTDKWVNFQVHLSNGESEGTTCSVTDTDCTPNDLEGDIYDVTSNEQIWFWKELSMHLIEFEAWWKAIDIQQLRKSIQQCMIHFRYAKRYLGSHIYEFIGQIG